MLGEVKKIESWNNRKGYLRPVDQWNDGKRAEFKDRVVFKVKKE